VSDFPASLLAFLSVSISVSNFPASSLACQSISFSVSVSWYSFPLFLLACPAYLLSAVSLVEEVEPFWSFFIFNFPVGVKRDSLA
jgi:hypothetical protein